MAEVKARRIGRYRALRKGFLDWDEFATTPRILEEEVKAIRRRDRIGPGPEAWRLPADSRRSRRRPTAVHDLRLRTSDGTHTSLHPEVASGRLRV